MALTEQLTLDEFLRQPEQKPALEYERGVISQKMAAMARHGKLQGDLYFRFRMHGYPRTVASALTETRVTWPADGTSYVPDVIAYLVEREPVDVDGEIPDHLFVPPDVAVEIVSPGQGLASQMDRCRWYAAHDVPVALLVHPRQRAVWTFRPGVESGPLRGADIVDLGDALPGFSFVVDDLFSVLRSRVR